MSVDTESRTRARILDEDDQDFINISKFSTSQSKEMDQYMTIL